MYDFLMQMTLTCIQLVLGRTGVPASAACRSSQANELEKLNVQNQDIDICGAGAARAVCTGGKCPVCRPVKTRGLFVNLTTDDTWSAAKAISFAHQKALKNGHKPVAIWLNVRAVYLADARSGRRMCTA